MPQGIQSFFFVAVQILPHKAHEEELRLPGIVVPQGGIQMVGGQIPLPGIQPDDGAAQAAGLLLAEGHHLPGVAPAMTGGADTQRVDDAHLIPGGGDGPGDGIVFRQLEAVQIHHAPEDAVLLTHIEGAGLLGLPGGVDGGVFAPLPVGIDGTLLLLVQNFLINFSGLGQVRGSGKTDHGDLSFSIWMSGGPHCGKNGARWGQRAPVCVTGGRPSWPRGRLREVCPPPEGRRCRPPAPGGPAPAGRGYPPAPRSSGRSCGPSWRPAR